MLRLYVLTQRRRRSGEGALPVSYGSTAGPLLSEGQMRCPAHAYAPTAREATKALRE